MLQRHKKFASLVVKLRRRKIVIKNFNLVNSEITLSFNDHEESIEGSPYGGQNDYVSKK